MKKSLLLGMFGMMAAMSYTEKGSLPTPYEERKRKSEPKKVIPKGCAEYWFLKSGRAVTEQPDANKYPTVFYCIATSLKSAEKKYLKSLK